jgi:hypothetical protein
MAQAYGTGLNCANMHYLVHRALLSSVTQIITRYEGSHRQHQLWSRYSFHPIRRVIVVNDECLRLWLICMYDAGLVHKFITLMYSAEYPTIRTPYLIDDLRLAGIKQ